MRGLTVRWISAITLLAAVGCAGQKVNPTDNDEKATPAPPICPASGVFAENEQGAYLIAAGETHIYWSAMEGIRGAPIAGGPATTVVPIQSVRAIAAQGGDLFVADYDQLAIRRFRDGHETILAQANANDLAVSGDYLYWAQNSADNTVTLDTQEGTIARVRIEGGPVEVLIDALECPMTLAVNDAAVFFSVSCSPMSVQRWSFETGAIDQVFGAHAPNLAATSTGSYFIGDTFPYALSFVANDGSYTEVTSLPSKGVVAVDDTGVYVGTRTGRVGYVESGGQSLETLATDLGGVQGIGRMVVVDGAVFATAPSSDQVLCIDRTPTKPAGDDACPELLGTAADVASTPRADGDMELLAIRLDGAVTATQSTYDRLVRDKATIQQALPGVDVRYFAPHDGKALHLRVAEPSALAMQDGSYTAWDCLNTFYGLESVDVRYLSLTDRWWADLTLKGRYDVVRLADLYATLPGVIEAMQPGRMGDGPTLCVSRTGDTYEYVVDDRGGDCPAGCTTTTAYYFVSDAAGVEHVDTWAGSPYASDAPAWRSICAGF